MSILDRMDDLRADARRAFPPDRLAGLMAIIDQMESLAWELETLRAALPRLTQWITYRWN